MALCLQAVRISVVQELLTMFRDSDQKSPGSSLCAFLVPRGVLLVRWREGHVVVCHRRRGDWVCQALLEAESGDEK